jgi:tryptophan 2,3-dioxygenase
MGETTPSYWDYLGLERLLELQKGFESDESKVSSDELHFIVVHQVFELWFKLTLAELRLARDHMAAPEVPEEHVPHVVHHLRRVTRILELCAGTFGVMETLTTQDFLAFRDKLIPASGFQSFQMRELEVLLGLADQDRVATPAGMGQPLDAIRKLGQTTPGGHQAIAHLDRVLAEGSFRAAVHRWLSRTPIQGSAPDSPGDAAAVQAFLEEYLQASSHRAEANMERLVEVGVMTPETARERLIEGAERARRFLQADDVQPGDDEGDEDLAARRASTRRLRASILFIETYRDLPLLAWPRMLLDTIIELESALILFRTRHARMVERVIGRRVGTGGSSGVDYLDATARYRVFTELWAVRTVLLARDAAPPLQDADRYGFAR